MAFLIGLDFPFLVIEGNEENNPQALGLWNLIDMPEKCAQTLVDHFFRHEYGRIVALLTKIHGLQHLDLVEDMVQSALVRALQTWPKQGIPNEPSAWIYRVARNAITDQFRKLQNANRLAPEVVATTNRLANQSEPFDDDIFDSEIEDGVLRMMFACSHPVLPGESQICLMLKTLCGFSIAEVAHALLTQPETVKKRISRAKQKLLSEQISLDMPARDDLTGRLRTVHTVIYLLFNEGYCASYSDSGIRTNLCEEAVRLCELLCRHPLCSNGATNALMALLLFHAARLQARIDEDGYLLLLEEQDRTQWDYGLIKIAKDYLWKSAKDRQVTPYHLEAGIAMYHCKARNFLETDWQAILRQYDLLLKLQRSPIYLLNRAIALSFVDGPQAGIQAIREIQLQEQLPTYHLLDATLGELHRRAGAIDDARQHFQQALEKAATKNDQQLIRRRLALCDADKEKGESSH